jgi:hypothetical protein
MDNVNWTKGIDQKTGKPIDYDPNKAIQTYAGIGNLICASRSANWHCCLGASDARVIMHRH